MLSPSNLYFFAHARKAVTSNMLFPFVTFGNSPFHFSRLKVADISTFLYIFVKTPNDRFVYLIFRSHFCECLHLFSVTVLHVRKDEQRYVTNDL